MNDHEKQVELLRESYSVLDEAEETYKPRARYALLSGGHDSLTATAVAMEWARSNDLPMGVAHIATGTGIPETTEFVKATCEAEDWNLEIFTPPVPYEDIVLEYGFPGPGQHGLMYQRLKERCLRQLIRQSKQKWDDRIMLVTGVRSEESVRRMRHVERIQREGATVWAADIWNWSKIECARYLRAGGFERNPVVDKIHMSGECLCGAFARPGEISEIEMWFPEHAAWLHSLEEKVAAKGLRGCVWGQRPPRVHREQMAMAFGEDWDVSLPGALCIGCGPEDELSDAEAEAA
jgi:3'-phosphoadenosine 5'-phosphosulfate sulfotransferase (PAPS reductase)/FAD synthetase